MAALEGLEKEKTGSPQRPGRAMDLPMMERGSMNQLEMASTQTEGTGSSAKGRASSAW